MYLHWNVTSVIIIPTKGKHLKYDLIINTDVTLKGKNGATVLHYAADAYTWTSKVS